MIIKSRYIRPVFLKLQGVLQILIISLLLNCFAQSYSLFCIFWGVLKYSWVVQSLHGVIAKYVYSYKKIVGYETIRV